MDSVWFLYLINFQPAQPPDKHLPRLRRSVHEQHIRASALNDTLDNGLTGLSESDKINQSQLETGTIRPYSLTHIRKSPTWSQSEADLGQGTSELANQNVIIRAQNGDANAMSELYEHYKPAVFKYLYYRSGAVQVAEELTTEVFIRVIQKLPRYQLNQTPFQAWLFTIARNLAIDHFRHEKTRQHVDLNESFVGTSDEPEALAEHNIQVERLQEALNQLTSDQCDVIVLRFLAGMPINEAALALNKRTGAIKMLQARALLALKKLLE
jgi:RNA polymerase sigma factor (sigma-70 family)